MSYSTTYIAQLAQFIGLALTLINIDIDPASLETTLSVIATIVAGVSVFIGRYKAGGITLWGNRTQ